jgi:hypothetical protein
MEEKSLLQEEDSERQPFHFRALMANYDYLCTLTRHDRFRSLNLCLNVILTLLRKHDVESLVELQEILRSRRKREEMAIYE